MKTKLLSVFLLLTGIFGMNSFAQDPPDEEQQIISDNNRLYAGGQASTNGLGFNLRYVFGKRFSLNAGMESLSLNGNYILYSKGIPFNTEVDYKSGGIFLLGEYFYSRSLYITAGLMSNNFRTKAEGQPLTDVRYGDIVLPASLVGTLTVQAEPEYRYSPYAGLGILRYVDKKHLISCTIETGFYYLGQPDMHLEGTGLLKSTADPAYGKEEYLEAQFSVYKYYPIVRLGIAARLF